MELDEQGQMIIELVAKFVQKELIPLENEVLAREARGVHPALPVEQRARLNAISKELGLWGLDAPEDLGGMNLPATVMAGVAEELAKTAVDYEFPPDSPNLRMIQAIGTEEQKNKYLPGYIAGELHSAIGITEPGAGGDPSAMTTKAVLDGDEWVLNGRKIWIGNAKRADFIIVMARVGEGKGREGITAFIVEKGTPGYIVERELPMLGDHYTYELVFDECRVPRGALLGEVGKGYAPMQLRLLTRRLEMGATACGITQRALDMLSEHALQRVTFGVRLADRQAIQWWIADTMIRLHASRLMIQDAARKVDRGEDVRYEASIIKVFATEMAYEAVDYAMQTLGALGMSKETALFPMWQKARLMRIYEGPTEVHRQTIAKRVLSRY